MTMSRFPWKPIDTAPRDGTEIVLWRPLGKRTRIGVDHWQSGAWYRTFPNRPPTHWCHLDELDPRGTDAEIVGDHNDKG